MITQFVINNWFVYNIIKFWKFADNKGYLIFFVSQHLKAKKIQKPYINTTCQNFKINSNIIMSYSDFYLIKKYVSIHCTFINWGRDQHKSKVRVNYN